MTLATEFHHKN